ncbi:DUF397 domain-containing protein [Streptomyces sp. NPDC058045]|uniref:DUF397 domain-containing protein n=1 Tax=Streptomyces sp. NPDC058045 TaxID=3346311 RepID=UPI0036E780A4
MSTGQLAWFKSSYSGGGGGECLEVGVGWQKSSYSGSGGDNCVEVAASSPASVHLRDSKDPAKGELTLDSATWSAFVGFATDHV